MLRLLVVCVFLEKIRYHKMNALSYEPFFFFADKLVSFFLLLYLIKPYSIHP